MSLPKPEETALDQDEDEYGNDSSDRAMRGFSKNATCF
jgi:hypothetical protein